MALPTGGLRSAAARPRLQLGPVVGHDAADAHHGHGSANHPEIAANGAIGFVDAFELLEMQKLGKNRAFVTLFIAK